MIRNFLVVMVLLLTLCVTPVMADLVTPMPSPIFDINNNVYTDSQSVNYGSYPSLTEFKNRPFYCNQETYNRMHSVVTESFTVNIYVVNRVVANGLLLDEIVYTVNCIGAPEPTPDPNTPRLEATQTASTPIYISYVIQTKPDTGYTFTEITTTPQEPTTILGIEFINPLQSWKPKQNKAFNVPRGSSTTFYTLAKNWQDVQIVTLTLSAPALFNTTNQSSPQIDPANPLYNPPPVPTVTPGNPNQNPLTSGKFRPSNAAIITPFTEFTENLHTYGRLPKIQSPAELRESALNGTNNVTAGLYDIIDRITGIAIFPATTTAAALNTVLNPIESMIIYCDEVLQQIIASVDNFMINLMPLRDFFYMLIPDFVWWIMSAIIILEMVLTVMSFLYGRSITLMHLFGFYKDSK